MMISILKPGFLVSGMARNIMIAAVTIALLTISGVTQSPQSSFSLLGCPNYPANPTNTVLSFIVNLTSYENMEGGCAIGALLQYNRTGVLSKLNNHVNVSALSQKFFSGNPLLPSSNLTNAIIANTTIVKITTPEQVCIWYTPISRNPDATHIKAHVDKCNSGLLKIATSVINVSVPNTTVVALPPINITPSNSLSSLMTFPNAPVLKSGFTPAAKNNDLSIGSVAGYEALNGPTMGSVSNVSGSWIIQPALNSSFTRASAQWVGIGGVLNYLDPSLVQIATVSCFNVPTSNVFPVYLCPNDPNAQYGAYLEYFPVPIPLNSFGFFVKEGDAISASVSCTAPLVIVVSSPLCNVYMKDLNNSEAPFIFASPYPSLKLTADWFEEGLESNVGVKLTNFINASFGRSYTHSGFADSATISGISGFIGNFTTNRLVISGGNISDNATTSVLTNDGSFKIFNFRVYTNFATPSNGTITQGNPFSLTGEALGGTGRYAFTWLRADSSSNYTAFRNFSCTLAAIAGPGPYDTCFASTNSSTAPGTYRFKLQVHDVDGPANETIISSTFLSMLVKPSLTCGTVDRTNITLTNTQSSSTGPNFQQMIVVNSSKFASAEASDLHNVEFFYPNCTVIPAWIESGNSNGAFGTIYWLRLASSIPSHSNVTIFMGFMNLSTNNFLNSSILGLAPQLSCNSTLSAIDGACTTYAQYDNGAKIFNNYENFANSRGTVPPGWYSSGTSGPCSYNDADYYNGYEAGGVNGCGVISMGSDIPVDSSIAIDVNLWGIQAADNDWQASFVNSASPTSYQPQSYSATWFDNNVSCNYFVLPGTAVTFSLTNGPGGSSAGSGPTLPPTVITITNNYIASDYTPIISHSGLLALPGYFAFASFTGRGTYYYCGSHSQGFWVRTRQLPPNGIMPGYTVDPVTNENGTIITLTTTISTTSTTVTTTSVTTTIPVSTNVIV